MQSSAGNQTRQHERRRAPRADAAFPVELTFRGATLDAQLKDLSENGLACSYPTAIDEMTQVGLALRLPDSDAVHPIQGAVVRCAKRRGVTPPSYEIAIFFTDVTVEGRAAIRDFVSNRLRATA